MAEFFDKEEFEKAANLLKDKVGNTDPYYFIQTPIGGAYGAELPVEKDEHVKFIETIVGKDDGFMSIFTMWNKKYIEIAVDEKYAYKGAHSQTKLSKDEAIRLRDALTYCINRMK